MSELQANELKPQLLGIHALNSMASNNSPSRGFMFSSHFTQHLVVSGLQEKILYAGPEQELAKYTLGVRMPANGKIIEVIAKYPVGVGQDSLGLNPENLVIYEDMETGVIDCFTIPIYKSFHQYFGWSCEEREGMEHLRPGAYIPKDTVFADTPGVKDGNSYMYGRNVPVAYMSVPGVSEDGIIIAESELQNWKYKIYDTRTVSWGSDHFPVHVYGPGQAFPEIGQYIREDGLLMALRPYDSDVFVVTTGQKNLQKVDYVFDKQTYVRSGRGRVVDVEILTNNNQIKNIPTGMSEQSDKYVRALHRYYQTIINVEDKLRLERKQKYGVAHLNVSPRFSKLIVRALAVTNYQAEKLKQTLKLIYRKEQIDEYHAKFVIEYELVPSRGDKLSNSSGSKGVICKILPDHEMPIRPDGLQAKMILDGGPVFHRMNIGQSYEQHYTCAAYDVTMRIAFRLGLIKSDTHRDFVDRPKIDMEDIENIDPEIVADCYEYLMTFYGVFNNMMTDHFGKLKDIEKIEHLTDIINEGTCTIFMPVDNPRLPDEIVRDLEKYFQPTRTTVKYVDQSGSQIETKKKIRIGFVYMFMLDKLAQEWSATSTARVQHFGILSSVTKSEKFAYPYRNSPTRISGETESRIFACYTGPEAIAEMFDRTNNSVARRNIYWNLLNAETPGSIENIIDRNVVPLGASRPIQIVNHVFMCSGFKPEYKPENIVYGG